MKKFARFLMIATLTTSFTPIATWAAPGERSMCQGDCANSPVPIKDVMALSDLSHHLTREQVQEISKEMIKRPSNESELITIPLYVHDEVFDPKKHTPKKRKTANEKALPFDEIGESALMLSFNMPTTHSTATEGRNRIRFENSTSNSLLHKTDLERKDGSKRSQKLDALGQTSQLTIERGTKEFSITMTIREHKLMGSPNSLDAYLSGDKLINAAHTAMGFRNTYGEQDLGLNKFDANIQDANGRPLKVQENRSYVLPMLVQLKHFDKIESLSSADGRAETTLVTGVQAAIPMSSTFSQGGIGTQGSVVSNFEVRRDLIATLAATMAINLERTFGDGYQPFDKSTNISWGGDISASLTCIGKNGSRTTTTLFVTADPTPLKGSNYKSPTGTDFQRRSQAASSEQDYAVGLAVTHETKKGLIVSGGCKEDIGGSQRRKKAIGGNNNRDFSCGFSVSKNF